jgi:hypothetical protein
MYQTTIFDSLKAKELKEMGMAIAASFPSDEWVVKARSLAVNLARLNGSVTIDDIKAEIGDPPRPNASGSAFKGTGLKPIGHTISKRLSARGREIKVYGRV